MSNYRTIVTVVMDTQHVTPPPQQGINQVSYIRHSHQCVGVYS